MGEHRSRRSSGRLLTGTLVAVIAAALLMGARSTGAYWTDEHTVAAGSLTSGSLDITLRPGTDGTFADSITLPAAALSGMFPGDSRAFSMAVRSDGVEAPLTYQVRGMSTGNADLGASLQTHIWLGGQATNTGSITTGYRNDQFGGNYGGSCPGGTQIGPATPLSTGSDVVLTTTEPTMEPGDIDELCVLVTLRDDAPGTAMDKTAAITFTVTARSVGR